MITPDPANDDDDPLSPAEELYLEFVMPDELPAEAMREAVTCWPEYRTFFLEAFTGHSDGTWDIRDAGDALLFLVHLFAQMHETAAYRPLVTLLRRPIEDLDDSLGDTLDVSLARILVGVFDGDPEPLESLMLDPSVHEYVRWPVLDAYVGLTLLGKIERERATRILLAISPSVFPADDSAWVGWISACAALREPALIAAARERMASGAITPIEFGTKDLEGELAHWASDPEMVHEATVPLDDAVAELAQWHGFSAAGVAERRKAETLGGSVGRDTYVNPNRDVGRNDPCPCGSGKKFKKCHGA